MDKILEKLGIYDLVGVIFTGLIISSLTKYIFMLLGLSFEIDINNTFQLLIISYFIGVVFQELGSKLDCWKILKTIFKPTNDLHISLSQKEIDYFMTEVYSKLKFDNNENHLVEIYNFCRSKNNNDLNSDRKQSLSGMARSLMIYFLFLSISLLICFLDTLNYRCLIFSSIVGFLCYLFYNRYVRFMKMKYVHVFRTYYYNNIQ